MKRIFITGGSGCIGHYMAESLIQETQHELFFLVRNPKKVGFDWRSRSGVNIVHGDLREIDRFADLLKTIDVAILAASAWGGTAEVFDINVNKTTRLMNLLDAEKCEQILYFSTASILNQNNQILKEASELGTDYIRSKYDCLTQLPRLEIASKITVLFPTLVFGGNGKNKPYSHISSGFVDAMKWISLARWFKADGSFHLVHAQDIAGVVKYLVAHPIPYNVIDQLDDIYLKQLVLGSKPMTVNEMIKEGCQYLGKRIYLQIPLSMWLANILINVFRIQLAPWDRFCMNYRHFTYKNPVLPSSFGESDFCPTFSDLLRISGVKGRRIKN
ncbi:MAG: NAD(P)-dependent oxidoreductase [Cyanobacteria bacterium SBLK]|nr:NAD(P)-dependent oxidoreductase [Cyanobacteria bacterium SBLK]